MNKIKKYLVFISISIIAITIIVSVIHFLWNEVFYNSIGNGWMFSKEKYGSDYCIKNCINYSIESYITYSDKRLDKLYKKVNNKNITKITKYYNNFKNEMNKNYGYEISLSENDMDNKDYFMFSTKNDKNILYYFLKYLKLFA